MVELFLMAGLLAGALLALAKVAQLVGSAFWGTARCVMRARVAWQLFNQPSRVRWDDIDELPMIVVELARGDRLWPRWWCVTVGVAAAVAL